MSFPSCTRTSKTRLCRVIPRHVESRRHLQEVESAHFLLSPIEDTIAGACVIQHRMIISWLIPFDLFSFWLQRPSMKCLSARLHCQVWAPVVVKCELRIEIATYVYNIADAHARLWKVCSQQGVQYARHLSSPANSHEHFRKFAWLSGRNIAPIRHSKLKFGDCF